jgi:hypothetical protein
MFCDKEFIEKTGLKLILERKLLGIIQRKLVGLRPRLGSNSSPGVTLKAYIVFGFPILNGMAKGILLNSNPKAC